jgi:hypothetical protein
MAPPGAGIDDAGTDDMVLRRGAAIALAIAVVLLSLYFALAIHYWLPWPAPVRTSGAIAFPLAVLALWFLPGRRRTARRIAAAAALIAIGTAYATKLPPEQDWVALQAEQAHASIAGDTITISNLRDAVHRPGAPSEPRWITERFDLSTLEGADLIIQPFGGVKALAHIMLSFRFADGRHVVVSMEARQAKGAAFDPVAGFFRRDQLYPELGTERDLIWERLARTPPDEVQIYPVKASPEAVRIYFRRIIDFVNESHRQPRFYSTLRESCMTTLMNLAPESFAHVPWRDIRRWIPGYSLSLFQQIGLVDGTLDADALARQARLRDGIRPPLEFATDAAWSRYIRDGRL